MSIKLFYHHTKYEVDRSNGLENITPPRNRRGVKFSLQFVCVCLCVCMSVSDKVQAYSLIWTRFSLNGCLLHWLKSSWIGKLWLKVKVTVTQCRFFFHNSLLNILRWISALLYPIKIKFGMLLRYALVDLHLRSNVKPLTAPVPKILDFFLKKIFPIFFLNYTR